MSTTVLNRLSSTERCEAQKIYNDGANVSLRIYGWMTPSGETCVSFCRLIRGIDSAKMCIDVSRLKHVTKTGETEKIITSEVDSELQSIIEQISDSDSNKLVAVVTDSAACNIGA